MNHTSEFLSPARQFARRQAENAAGQMMNTISWVKRFAWVITLAAMTVSYQHQLQYLHKIKVDWLGAVLIPIIFDSMAIVCVMIVGAQAMRRLAKVVAVTVVLFPVGASGYINVQASPTRAVAIAYSLAVLAIPVTELVKSVMGADFSAMIESEATLEKASRAPAKGKADQVGTDASPAELAARKRAGYSKMTAGQKRAWTRTYRSKQRERVNQIMPVSPGLGPVEPRFERAYSVAQ